jgi:hypothetical protein
MSQKIVELMQVPPTQHDLAWLKKSVQAAVELELSTIPPYLCGYWSIASDDTMQVSTLVRGVAIEEMIHLSLVCNLLTALGEVPQITGGYKNEIKYPGGLPGGVHPGLTVSITGLTPDVVKNVYMEIEKPEQPLTLAAESFPTIGAFYDAISNCLTTLKPVLLTKNQLTTTFGHGAEITVLATIDEAVAAINEIKEQGEGTSAAGSGSPWVPIFITGEDPSGNFHELAHYYKFSEIYYGASLINLGGKWAYEGTPILFPTVVNMPPVPSGGYQNPSPTVATALSNFDIAFTGLLNGLQNAWAGGSDVELQSAIDTMFTLQPLAKVIFALPLPDNSGFYGPQFKYISN